jgi:hypothetical protein
MEDGDVEQYSWIEGKEIVADVFTKQGSKKEALDEIIKNNNFVHAQREDNLVVYEDEEIRIKNLRRKRGRQTGSSLFSIGQWIEVEQWTINKK